MNVADHHDIGELVDAVHHAAIDFDIGPLAGMRTRAAAREHYRIAGGEPTYALIAIHARLGPGRERDQKRAFIEHVLAGAQVAVGESPLHIAWSIEVTELDADLRINDNNVKVAMDSAAAQNNAATHEGAT